MKTKPLYLLNVILAFALLTSLLANAAVNRSATADTFKYNAWADLNDDGIIDIFDIATVAVVFGTTGTPINKTALLYEVNATFTQLRSKIDSLNESNIELRSRIDSLNTSFIDLEAYLETKITNLNTSLVQLQSRVDNLNYTMTSTVNDLNAQIVEMNATITDLRTEINILSAKVDNLNSTLASRINDLNDQIAWLKTELGILNATKLGKPKYDSGWVTLIAGQNKNFTHNLNTTNVLVYMIGKDADGANDIHQINFGGETDNWQYWGAYWFDLTETKIMVRRQPQDIDWDEVRIMIWKIPES